MRKHEVKCRVCKQVFDTAPLIQGQDWIMPTKNFYYHTKCYNEWQTKKDNVKTSTLDDELWRDSTYQYLQRDLKIPVVWNKFSSQWKNLMKKGRTAKGIYFAVRYFYEIEKGDKEKAKGGIGIVDYVYNQSASYWSERERNSEGIIAQIEQQVRERAEREQIIIKRAPSKKKKKKFTLEMVEEIE